MTGLVLAPDGGHPLGRLLADALGLPLGAVESRRFPDGETYLRLDAECRGRHVIIACTLDRPDPKLLPLVFLAGAARAEGAVRVGLVAPYLAYMRQDQQFRPGEAVTSRMFATLLSRHIDWLVTVDPHLHRVHTLDEIYTVPTRVVAAAPALAAWIAAHVPRPLVVGPDEESTQWVRDVATRAGAPFVVMRKVRRGDREVEIASPDVSAWRDRTAIVVDDVVSSGQTMIVTVRRLIEAGLAAPVCLAVHALFAAETAAALRAAGASGVIATNTIDHPAAAIDIVPLLAPAIADVAGRL